MYVLITLLYITVRVNNAFFTQLYVLLTLLYKTVPVNNASLHSCAC